MSAARLWCPITQPAPFWLKPLPRNACSPVADGAALGACARLPTVAGRRRPLAALSSAIPAPVETTASRLVWGYRSSALAWAADGLCPVPWKAAPWTCEAPHGAEHVPCTSCGCGCFDLHAHIHSWCTTNLAFAASLRFSCQNSGARTPRSPVTAPPSHRRGDRVRPGAGLGPCRPGGRRGLS